MKFKTKNFVAVMLAFAIFTVTFMSSCNIFLANSEALEMPEALKTLKTLELSENNIVFYVENPVYLSNGAEKQIDADNKKVVPYLKNGHAYVPVRFVTEALGGSIEWNDEKKAATVKTKIGDIFVLDSNLSELYEDRLYMPADLIAEMFGEGFFYERGLIIIANKNNLPDSTKNKTEINSLIKGFTSITQVGSKENLIDLLGYDPTKSYPVDYNEGEWVDYDAGFDYYQFNEESGDGAAVLAEAPGNSKPDASESSDYSETNTQVKGVDEADIIKTDGQFIYYVRNNKIDIVKVDADGTFEYMSAFEMPKIPYGESLNFSEIFLDKDKITAIGKYYGSGGPDNYKYSGFTTAIVINIEDKKSPSLERIIEVEGDYLTSRKIGGSVYFVVNRSFWNWYDGDIMPLYRDTNNSGNYGDMIQTGYEDLNCFPIINGESITTLVGFNVDRPEEEAFIDTYFGCGDNIYMSEKALYITAVKYKDTGTETVINKFATDDGKLVFVKSGVAPGTVLNQFSMDEHKSYFRIATTVQEYTISSWGYAEKFKEYNGLYIFDNSMQLVGRIDDIAPGELIYSARFMGDRAYMVTFRTVDPLFAIDLSNPREPVIMGALKIPGYSNYLHPYDENHLIGFGKDTYVDSYNNAYYTSMKISLFDVTDITNPIEMFVETIGDRGTDSPLLSNHKALLFSKEKGLLAFPVTVFETNKKSLTNEAEKFGSESFAFAGAYVYDIDLTIGFNLRGKISHLSDQDMLKSSYWGGDSNLYIQRLITIKDALYAASNNKLSSHNLQTQTIESIYEFVFDK